MKLLFIALMLSTVPLFAEDPKAPSPAPISADDRARLMQYWLDLANIEAQIVSLQKVHSDISNRVAGLAAELRRTYKAEECTPALDRDPATGLIRGVRWSCPPPQKPAEKEQAPASK